MKKRILLLLVLLPVIVLADFEDTFFPKTLRIDYYHTGDHRSEQYSFDEARIEPYWGGSMKNLVDTFQYGNHFFKVFEKASDSLIYSRGYSSLFREWQTTAEARNTRRSFTETVVCPLPRNPCTIVFYSRDTVGDFAEKFHYDYDPYNYFISRERGIEYPVFDAYVSGPSEQSIDIVVLPEGYSANELGLFVEDVIAFSKTLFQFSPYDKYPDKFNIRGVLAPSRDSGSDIPADTIWTNTLMSTSFYTFDSERYCMTYDNKSVRDLASNAPYDQIYILVNSEKYGGGAIYNYYSVSVNSNRSAAKIFIHEFGHGFAGLGDEYYNSEEVYNEFYPHNIEPWEPNLTTLIDFDRKWKQLLNDSIPIPTPMTEEFRYKTGVFEGGGYAAKGVYRPGYDCLMNTFKVDRFCEACEEAIEKMIRFYIE